MLGRCITILRVVVVVTLSVASSLLAYRERVGGVRDYGQAGVRGGDQGVRGGGSRIGGSPRAISC